MSFVAVVLAAGESRRMGENKLLLAYKGKPIIRHVVEACLVPEISDIIVVTGFERERIENALSGLDVIFCYNRDYCYGMTTSFVRGVKSIIPNKYQGIFLLLGDQPFVTCETIEHMIDIFRKSKSPAIVVPVYNGKKGHPVLFDIQLYKEIISLERDNIIREIIHRHSDNVIKTEERKGVIIDIDTPEDYLRYLVDKNSV